MTTRTTIESAESLIELLMQQRVLYEELRDMADRQHEVVESGNSELLLRILASRQRIINRLTEIERALKPYRREWKTFSESLAPDQRELVQTLVKDVQGTLQAILDRDDEDSKSLSHQKDTVAGSLRTTRSGRQVNHAYASPFSKAAASSNEGRYFDTRSQ